MPRPKKIKPTKKPAPKSEKGAAALKAQVQKLRVEVRNVSLRFDSMRLFLLTALSADGRGYVEPLGNIIARLEDRIDRLAPTSVDGAPQTDGSVIAATPDGQGLVEHPPSIEPEHLLEI